MIYQIYDSHFILKIMSSVDLIIFCIFYDIPLSYNPFNLIRVIFILHKKFNHHVVRCVRDHAINFNVK
jgi:hypothetical protein